ncbi:hypothetical protein ANN_20592 [Periplaneta americana]|uniref:Uncharacterized protein n=1 Tax=Periplaneta americana TaxID=6978 RepID=A0ABQ8SD10_PERAM|nr:hypothetical protein ANN_20592 [Periplaneta americana]
MGNDIKMDLREVGYDDRDWINLAQDRDQWLAYVSIETYTNEKRHSSFEATTATSARCALLANIDMVVQLHPHMLKLIPVNTSHNCTDPSRLTEKDVAQHSLETGHKIDFGATTILDKTSGYWDLVIKEAIEIQLDGNNFNRDGGLQLSTAWKPAINTLRPPAHGRQWDQQVAPDWLTCPPTRMRLAVGTRN